MNLDAKAREAIVAQRFTSGVPLSQLDDEESEPGHVIVSATSSDTTIYGTSSTMLETYGWMLQPSTMTVLGEPRHSLAYHFTPPTEIGSDLAKWSGATDWVHENLDHSHASEPLSLQDLQIHLQNFLSLYESKLEADVYGRFSRLLPILLDPDEYDEEDKLPDPTSFRSMLDFLVEHPYLDVPRLNVSRQGHFKLSWRKSENELTTLEYRPDRMIDWLVFAPPARGSRSPQRAAGESAVSEILNILKVQNALAWMRREQ